MKNIAVIGSGNLGSSLAHLAATKHSVTITKLFVYGDTTPEIRAKLDGSGAEYLTPFAGFSR